MLPLGSPLFPTFQQSLVELEKPDQQAEKRFREQCAVPPLALALVRHRRS